jgi:2,3-dihydroxybenzoate-AMP ligase
VAKVARYTPELVTRYTHSGHWLPEYTPAYWRRNASLHAEREALVAPDGRYTWAASCRAIDGIVAGLRADGWRRDEVLVLQAPNSAQLLLLRLACEEAGVVTALVPATFSRAEIKSIVAQLSPRGVALPAGPRGEELLRIYAELGNPDGLLSVRYSLGRPGLPGARPLSAWLDPKQAAAPPPSGAAGFGPYEYASIVTSSGTTGAPKCIEHTSCARLAAGRQYQRRLNLTSADVIGGFTSLYSGNCDLLLYHAAPQAGARVVLLDHFTPEAACRLIEQERVTGAVFVPTLLHRLLAYARLAEHDLSSLRFVTSFGAMLVPEMAARAEDRLGVRVIQGYGAAEYGALASTAMDDPKQVRLGAVGRPLPGTEIEIRDASGTVLPMGDIGRIHGRGPYCVGGFAHDPAATREAWQTGFFAMGDLGRVDEQGFLWLEGRARDVIIRGGQNVVPQEIEDALLRHPAIREAAAVGLPDSEMGERICVFVVAADGASPSLERLREFLLERGLARFKLPERLEVIDALPLNPAGTKVDKRALRQSIASSRPRGA